MFVLKAYSGGTVFAETYGQGPVRVVWLHGWARRGSDFAGAAQLLATSGVASVALDLPGFGSSPLPEHAGGARYYATLIDEVLSEISSEPLVLVGHSFGGRVALCFAATHPERVHALVLSAAPLVRRTRSRSPIVFRVVRRLVAWHLAPTSALDAARERYGSSDYNNASGLMRDVLVASINENYNDELRAWRGSTTLVWGTNDTDVPLSVATAASELLAGTTRIVQLDGVGHLTVIDAPRDIANAALEALS